MDTETEIQVLALKHKIVLLEEASRSLYDRTTALEKRVKELEHVPDER